MKMATRHYVMTMHNINTLKYIVLASKDRNVTKNLTTHRTLAWQHIHVQYDCISTKLKWLLIG